MASSINLKALGLNTSQNQLEAPQGSLLQAENVIIRRESVVESRRGIKLYGDTFGTTSDRAKQIIDYKDRLIRHYATKLQYDSDNAGTFEEFAGDYLETDASPRIKSIESNGNLYFTTADGIKKISARTAADFTTDPGFITNAGGIKAVDITAYINPLTTQAPWLLNDSVVAYRVVWGYKDLNENLILGSPSERSVVYNPLLSSLLRDYMKVLESLDAINQTGSLITDGDYVSTLKLPINATAADLRTNLIALVLKIDTDIYLANSTGSGVPLTINAGGSSVSGGIATIAFSGSPTLADYFAVGDKIFLSGFSPAGLNGIQTLTSVDDTTDEIQFLTSETTYSGTGDIYSGQFRGITEPAALSDIPTHDDVDSLRVYLQSIIDTLQLLPIGIVSSSLVSTYLDILSIISATTVKVEITIPSEITTNHFYQLYRTIQLTATGTDVFTDLIPGDEMRLVYEANPTQDELDAGIIILEDVTPDEFAGANLYTNPSSGEGILQANDLPPFAKDISKFKDVTFYANTRTRNRLQLQLLGVVNMVEQYNLGNIPTLTITNGDITETYSFVVGEIEETTFTCIAKASITTSAYFTINSCFDRNEYYFWYDTTGTDPDPAITGRFGVKIDISSASIVTASDVAAKTADVMSQFIDDFNVVANTNDVVIANTIAGPCSDADVGTSGFTVVIVQGVGEKVAQETSEFTCVADVAGSLAGKYFTLDTAFNQDNYYVWYKVNGGGVDPAISGRTGIIVDIALNDSANTVASKTALVLDALTTKFTSSSNSAILTVRNVGFGPARDATVGTSGFALNITTQGALDVLLSSLISPAQAVDETIRSLVRVININKSDSVYAFNISSTEDLPGKILLESKSLGSAEFYLSTDRGTTGASFSPDLSPTLQINSISVGSPTTITTTTNHGLTTGSQVVLSNTNSIPVVDGLYTVTVLNATQFTIPRAVNTSGNQGSANDANLTNISENEERGNRIYYSKIQQPEAVPILNYFDVGSKDRTILRIIPLRDSLFVFKEDGLYRVSGELAPFTVSLFDNTVQLIATDSPAVLDSHIYAWTDGGINIVGEGGVSLVSRPIDIDTIRIQSLVNFEENTFGFAYHTDNSYIVFTVRKDTDENASFAYRYSTLTNSWTTYEHSSTCGLVKFSDDKIYLGAGNENSLEVERKSFTRRDYADREYEKEITTLTYMGNMISFPVVSEIAAGDVLVQTQTVTNYIFNMLLKKLDIDGNLADTDYFSSLEATNGNDLSDKLSLLIEKVRDDTGRQSIVGFTPSVSYTALLPVSTNFTDMQNTYNDFINLMNADLGIMFSNYKTVDFTTDFETVITSVDYNQKKIVLQFEEQFIEGPVSIFKSIPTKITYTAQTMGDPLSLKHFYEATLMVEARTFTNATLSFATDLLPNFESITFNGNGSGGFGISNPFGDNFFGGVSNAAPLRTIIPRTKQRCRYMLVKFQHNTAFEKYSILGTTITGNLTSIRGYR